MRSLPALLLAVTCTSLCHAQPPANLVTDPGFEEVTGQGLAVGWSGEEFGKPGDSLIVDATVAHSGRRSVRLGVRANAFVTCQASAIGVKPDTTYYVAWWCKTSGLRQARAYLWLESNQAQRVLEDAQQYGTQDWTLHLAEYRTTAEETSLAPVPTTHDMGGAAACHAWFDDIGLYEGGFPPGLDAKYAVIQRQRSSVAQTAMVR